MHGLSDIVCVVFVKQLPAPALGLGSDLRRIVQIAAAPKHAAHVRGQRFKVALNVRRGIGQWKRGGTVSPAPRVQPLSP